ncbi:apolipoprotein N-acyltransferase [Geomonas silvestris]|uniref:Apolipoprotein N-acyltransferase n=1 Tax=Geomonas silvestris TaxID=2740184 RepID=A0A6V8MP09_9BACT|nr:apolipoprotein N-acyltransferase [Geomonas silvestris]GFO61795.1 apolipoprotein N-acyltransferase [Geomonas silvestris]
MTDLFVPGKGAAWGPVLLALTSGVLLALSFPDPGISLLAWCALVPLLVAAAGTTPARAALLGFVTGLVAYLGILYWLNIVMTSYGKLPAPLSALLYLVLAAYLALYPALVVWLARKGEEGGISPLCSFPVLWVAAELVRSFLLTGFPWANLGYSQFRTLPLIQISDLTGVYGVSFLVAFANLVFFRMWLWLRRSDAAYPVRSFLALLILVAATLGYGFAALNRPEQGPLERILLVQGNIPQQVKWQPEFASATVETYERLSRQGCRAPGTLVVWPESALPFFLQSEPQYAARVQSLAAELKSCLIAGSPAFEREGELTRYLNSAFLIAPSGALAGRSDKQHLVPFGEYVPLKGLFPFVNKLVAGIGDFSPGRELKPLETGNGKIGVLVCFEGIFPEISRAYVRQGAGLLVNITNDAWFGRSSAPYQHLSMTVFRAVENRVPLVRAANTGISAIIDSKGHVRGMTQLFQEATLAGQVRRGAAASFYSRHGDLFALGCLGASLGGGLSVWYRRSKKISANA